MESNAPRPEWLRKQTRLTEEVLRTKSRIDRLGLSTVCESARCPNLAECFACGNATFLILGERCTRKCGFCAVTHGSPSAVDAEEGAKIARYMEAGGIRFAVLTSVTRDDLPDGGADHFRRVVGHIKAALPAVKLELLVPDFLGSRAAIEAVAGLPVEVFAHNLETVASLYPRVRPQADYGRSLGVLQAARGLEGRTALIKSGIMVGLGEEEGELEALFADLARCGVDLLTLGQYLRPGKANLPVRRYYSPIDFERLREKALGAGLKHVLAGPYVRSSYLAEQNYLEGLGKMFDKGDRSTYNSY